MKWVVVIGRGPGRNEVMLFLTQSGAENYVKDTLMSSDRFAYTAKLTKKFSVANVVVATKIKP